MSLFEIDNNNDIILGSQLFKHSEVSRIEKERIILNNPNKNVDPNCWCTIDYKDINRVFRITPIRTFEFDLYSGAGMVNIINLDSDNDFKGMNLIGDVIFIETCKPKTIIRNLNLNFSRFEALESLKKYEVIFENCNIKTDDMILPHGDWEFNNGEYSCDHLSLAGNDEYSISSDDFDPDEIARGMYAESIIINMGQQIVFLDRTKTMTNTRLNDKWFIQYFNENTTKDIR